MGEPTQATTPSDNAQNPGQAPQGTESTGLLMILAQNPKAAVGLFLLVSSGLGTGTVGFTELNKAAEERVLRRQAAERQTAQVQSNGEKVEKLAKSVAGIEDKVETFALSMEQHTELTRTVIELLMTSPNVMQAVQSRPELQARAAKAVERRED